MKINKQTESVIGVRFLAASEDSVGGNITVSAIIVIAKALVGDAKTILQKTFLISPFPWFTARKFPNKRGKFVGGKSEKLKRWN